MGFKPLNDPQMAAVTMDSGMDASIVFRRIRVRFSAQFLCDMLYQLR